MTQAEARAFLSSCDPGLLRTRAGITLAVIGIAAGTHPGTVWKWETGRCLPKGTRLGSYVRVIAGLARHEAVEWEDEADDVLIGAAA